MSHPEGMYFMSYKPLKPGRFAGHVLSDEEWAGVQQAAGAAQFLASQKNGLGANVFLKGTLSEGIPTGGGGLSYAQTPSTMDGSKPLSPSDHPGFSAQPSRSEGSPVDHRHPLRRDAANASSRNPQPGRGE